MKNHSIIKLLLVAIVFAVTLFISCNDKEEKFTEIASADSNLTQEKAEQIITNYYNYGKEVFLNWKKRKSIEFPSESFVDKELSEFLQTNKLEDGASGTGFKYDLILSYKPLEEFEGDLILPVSVNIESAFVLKSYMTLDFFGEDEVIESFEQSQVFYVFDKDSHKIKNVYIPYPNYLPNDISFSHVDKDKIHLMWNREGVDYKRKSSSELDQINKEYLEGNITQEEAIEKGNILQKQISLLKIKSQSYNPDDAVEYALEYAYDYNTAFISYENDCANFISQCLLAGGFSFKLGNSRSCNAWWYDDKGTNVVTDDTASQTWTTANGLRRYLSVCNTPTHTYGYDDARYGKSAEAQKGDLCFWDFSNDGVYDHATMITYAWQWSWQTVRDIRFTYHTSNRRNIKISDERLIHMPNWNPVFVRI